MPSRLIIVESPSKARTLSRFLGSDYTVLASMGHVRDLPKSKIGVDLEAGFQPEYEVIKGKEKQIRDLKTAAKKAQATLLAADLRSRICFSLPLITSYCGAKPASRSTPIFDFGRSRTWPMEARTV
jgi:hypothetical protein